jgi:hypothetical protein
MRWKTQDILNLFSHLNCQIATDRPGGDYDTTVVTLTPKNGDSIFVSGFNTETPTTNPDDMDIEMVEVSDGLDSSGGLNSSKMDTCRLYAEAFGTLRNNGFHVVKNMRDYF